MTFAQLVSTIVGLIDWVLIPLIFALAFLAFLWGILKYFFLEAPDEGKEEGKQFILYGLLGLVVLFSVWGLVNVVLFTFGI
jgi:hypothetical protein